MIKTSKYVGDCLEAIGIPSKGEVVYDTDLKPEVFDLVICDSVYSGSIGALMKECIRTGERPVVQTRYKDCSRNYAFAPAKVFGVVIEVWDDSGKIVYKRFEPDRSKSPAFLVHSFLYDAACKTQYRYDAAFRKGNNWEVLHRLLRRLDILNYLMHLVRKEL